MYKINTKKIGIIILLLLQLSFIVIPSANAILMDGVVNEVTWDPWFIDSGTPSFSTYNSSDETYVYIGIITGSSVFGNNDLEFAFKGVERDWVIKISDILGLKYKISDDSDISKYWGPSKTGLPEGVHLVQGVTDGNISYEIRIERELLGEYSEDLPNNLEIWIMVASGSEGRWIWSIIDIPDGEVNFYPEARADWWFILKIEDDSTPSPEGIPSFSAPELPIGTIMSIILMLSAMIVVRKRQPLSSL